MNIRVLIKLLRKVSVKSIKKGEVLIQKGATGNDIFYIRKGLIRSYYYDEEKLEEITFQLYPENNIIVNLHGFLFNEPSKFTYQAMEDSKMYKIDFSSFMEMTSKNPDFIEINRMFVGRKAIRQAFQRVESFVFLSPEERYQKYIKDYPNIVNRAPDKHIANVLGITPVSLSRIRKRIASKKS